ncbi:MAG TPA: alpha/beta fold hydrolase [Thermomicrobiales bacterium]|nr:alpha/beta fold hydrolase [Thermomicrobiales bacterium]
MIVSVVFVAGSLAAALPPSPGGANGARQGIHPRPPAQPVKGPGGSAAPFARVEHRRLGEMPTGGWFFFPADAEGVVPTAKPLPLVIFFHGYTSLNPGRYLSWINHLALNGAAVFYPDYQDANFGAQDPSDYLPDAMAGVEMMLGQVGARGLPVIEPDRVVVVGHSLGGVLAANYAAVAEAEGVPIPRVLMPVEPGGCAGCGSTGDQLGAPVVDLDSIPATIMALIVAGEDDTIVGDIGAKVIWAGLDHVPLDQRDFIVVRSDTRGDPPLVSDHLMPQTAGTLSEVDALDFLGLWKLLDGLMACAFTGDWCEVALGGTERQRSLGEWSDGVPVKPLMVTDHPS